MCTPLPPPRRSLLASFSPANAAGAQLPFPPLRFCPSLLLAPLLASHFSLVSLFSLSLSLPPKKNNSSPASRAVHYSFPPFPPSFSLLIPFPFPFPFLLRCAFFLASSHLISSLTPDHWTLFKT